MMLSTQTTICTVPMAAIPDRFSVIKMVAVVYSSVAKHCAPVKSSESTDAS